MRVGDHRLLTVSVILHLGACTDVVWAEETILGAFPHLTGRPLLLQALNVAGTENPKAVIEISTSLGVQDLGAQWKSVTNLNKWIYPASCHYFFLSLHWIHRGLWWRKRGETARVNAMRDHQNNRDLFHSSDCKVDLSFLIDGSSSIGKRRFRIQKQFLADVAQTLDIGPGGPLMGVVQYG